MFDDDEFELPDCSYYGLTLKNTCYACPEQYDVFYEGTLCGYMRLRHGWFRTEYYKTPEDCENYCGVVVYECYPKGDGIFMNDEREEHLKKGAKEIVKRMRDGEMNSELKEQLEEISKQLNGKLTYYKCVDRQTQHQKIEIIYDKKPK